MNIVTNNEDAKKKWCPIEKSLCRANECAMWREPRVVFQLQPNQPMPEHIIINGFCGLVGGDA